MSLWSLLAVALVVLKVVGYFPYSWWWVVACAGMAWGGWLVKWGVVMVVAYVAHVLERKR